MGVAGAEGVPESSSCCGPDVWGHSQRPLPVAPLVAAPQVYFLELLTCASPVKPITAWVSLQSAQLQSSVYREVVGGGIYHLTSPLYREKPLLTASVFSVVKGRAQSPAGSYQDSHTVLADQGLRTGLGLAVSWMPQNTSSYGFSALLRATTGRECLVYTGHQERPCDLKLHPSMGHSFSQSCHLTISK